jgi:hypothetical protein
MGSIGALFALFVAGYILGVWTACVVLRQGQGTYEDAPQSAATQLLDPSGLEEGRR